MHTVFRPSGPTILLRISDRIHHMHRAFNDFSEAVKSAEAFAGAGFAVEMVSATGQFLMGFSPKVQRLPNPVAPRPLASIDPRTVEDVLSST